MRLLAQTEWQPGIGDPSVIGWITVVAYFLATYFCFHRAVAKRPQQRDEHWPTIAWWCLTAAMLLLGINKQLDLQTWLTTELRKMSLREGWYERRREYQLLAIQCMAVIGALGTGGMLLWFRKWWREFWTVLLGCGLLLTFIVIRAASYHHVDLLLKADLAGLNFNAFLELSAIACIGIGAALQNKNGLVPSGAQHRSSDRVNANKS
jgi:hypothetical protein